MSSRDAEIMMDIFDRRAYRHRKLNMFVTFAATRMAFNAGCFDWLKSANAVEVLIDRESNRIAFRQTDASNHHSYRIHRGPSSAVISAAEAFRSLGNPAGRYKATVNNAEGILEIDLSSPALPTAHLRSSGQTDPVDSISRDEA